MHMQLKSTLLSKQVVAMLNIPLDLVTTFKGPAAFSCYIANQELFM